MKHSIPLPLLLSVSPEISSFHLKSYVRFMCPNYFNLLITAQVSGEMSGLNLIDLSCVLT